MLEIDCIVDAGYPIVRDSTGANAVKNYTNAYEDTLTCNPDQCTGPCASAPSIHVLRYNSSEPVTCLVASAPPALSFAIQVILDPFSLVACHATFSTWHGRPCQPVSIQAPHLINVAWEV